MEQLLNLALTLLALTPAAAIGIAIGNRLRRTRDLPAELVPQRRQIARR